MSYTQALWTLAGKGKDERYVVLPDIKTYDPQLGRTLLAEIKRPGKRMLTFSKYIARAGMSVVLLAFDADLDKEVIVKFAKPLTEQSFDDSGKRIVFDKDEKIEEKLENQKKFLGMKMLGSLKKNTVGKLQERNEALLREKVTDLTKRFERQVELQRVARNSAISCKYGYIPEIYEVGKAPKLYCTMEYIKGKTVDEYLVELEKKEDADKIKLELFYNMLQLVNVCCHANFIVHSDLKDNNFIIMNSGLPCLFDFGISKNLVDTESSFTRENDPGWVSDAYSHNHQKDAFKFRVFKDDLYSMFVLLWKIWTGRLPKKEKFESFDSKLFVKDVFPKHLQEFFVTGINRSFESAQEACNCLQKIIEKYYTAVTAEVTEFKDLPAREKINILIKKQNTLIRKIDDIQEGIAVLYSLVKENSEAIKALLATNEEISQIILEKEV